MSLLAQPGVQARDLIFVQPLAQRLLDPVDEDSGYTWQPVGDPIKVFSRKLTSGEAYRQGKTDTNLNYTLYADYRRGQVFPLTEKMRVWHPEASGRLENDEPDYDTALDIRSVVLYAQDGVAQVDVSRDW